MILIRLNMLVAACYFVGQPILAAAGFRSGSVPCRRRPSTPSSPKSSTRSSKTPSAASATTTTASPRAPASDSRRESDCSRDRAVRPAAARFCKFKQVGRLPAPAEADQPDSHTGGERIRQGSDEEKLLHSWVTYLSSLPAAPASSNATRKTGPQITRRLTHSQYNNTVRDLLGDESKPAAKFPTEDFVHGFTNQAEGQGMSPLLSEAYNRAAEKLARNAFRGGDGNRLIPCKPAGPADAACRDRFVREFGLRAFRRSLTAGRSRALQQTLRDGSEPHERFSERRSSGCRGHAPESELPVSCGARRRSRLSGNTP